MARRPILRFPDPVNSERRLGTQGFPPGPSGPNRQTQGQRFQATFDRLEAAFNELDPEFALRQDPSGIAPDRALVFITAGSVQKFARVAQDIGLEVFAESELEEIDDFPDGFEPPGDGRNL